MMSKIILHSPIVRLFGVLLGFCLVIQMLPFSPLCIVPFFPFSFPHVWKSYIKASLLGSNTKLDPMAGGWRVLSQRELKAEGWPWRPKITAAPAVSRSTPSWRQTPKRLGLNLTSAASKSNVDLHAGCVIAIWLPVYTVINKVRPRSSFFALYSLPCCWHHSTLGSLFFSFDRVDLEILFRFRMEFSIKVS